MRKIFCTVCMALLGATAMADNEQTTIDASKVSKITFEGDNVNIAYNDGTADATFDMAEIIIKFSGTSAVREQLSLKDEAAKGDWYNLKGQKLAGKPSAKGVYINHGKKVVVKE